MLHHKFSTKFSTAVLNLELSSTAVHVPRYLLRLGLGLGLGHAQITAVLHQILHDLIFIQISALVKYYSAGGVLLLLRFPRIREVGGIDHRQEIVQPPQTITILTYFKIPLNTRVRLY